MKYIVSFLIIASICSCLNAQQISGVVYGDSGNGNKATLPAANVYWEGTQQGVTADKDGNFIIDLPQNSADRNLRLIASFVGHQNDTIDVSTGTHQVEFVLWEGVVFDETVVSARRKGSYMSRITPIQTEIVTTSGLQKMACCNLAESFENSATVTVGFTDAVSGAKQIQMLGLSGMYTQMLDENVPTLRGLASIFGWNYVPGPWLESIQVSKGTSSVINGYESTTGQINLEFKKPDHTETLFINLFGSEDGRVEANVTSAAPVGKNGWTGLMLHGSAERVEHDLNNDGFLDMPKTKQFNMYSRWIYDNHEKEIESRTDIKFLYDEREGGQTSEAEKIFLPFSGYITHIENINLKASNKTGFAFGGREGQSIGIINSFTRHEINSRYGVKTYGGKQNTWYSNILVSSFIGNTFHKYVVGGSFMYDRFDEYYSDARVNPFPETLFREELVPGAFAQYTYTSPDKLIFIIGARGDYHNRYGMLFTPRTNVKYNFTDNIIFRVSAGRGYRSPNIISENIGYLASSRYWDVTSATKLDIEKAWNYGANLTFYLPMPEDKSFTISLDYYRTDFDNQAVADMEYDKHRIIFYDLNDAKSYANAWQIDVNTTPFKGFDIFAAFRWNDTKISYRDANQGFLTVEKPLTNKYRGLINISYATNFEKWKFDVTAQLNGKSRLPSLLGHHAPKEYSPAYPLYFAQITKKTKRLDIYAGCENILNYKQSDPIIDASNPFGTDFDASRIWGPLMGRKFYAGIRLTLGEIK